MIAAQYERDRAVHAVNDQCFQGLLRADIQRRAQRADGFHVRRCNLFEFLPGRRSLVLRSQGFRRLDIRGVIVGIAVGDGVFAGIGQDMEFLRAVAAYFSGIRIHDPKFET